MYLYVIQGSPPGSKCLGEWRKDTLFPILDAMTIFVCTSYQENLPGKIINSNFTRTALTSWVYSIAVLLALFGYTRYRRAHDRSVLEKNTQHYLIIHETFTPYDMYDFDKSVTIRTPA